MNQSPKAPRSKAGPRFVRPPESLFRRGPLVDPGLAAVFGAALALTFMAVLLALFTRAG
jgi:hypothetical protein